MYCVSLRGGAALQLLLPPAAGLFAVAPRWLLADLWLERGAPGERGGGGSC
jgi:hypothetical protein